MLCSLCQVDTGLRFIARILSYLGIRSINGVAAACNNSNSEVPLFPIRHMAEINLLDILVVPGDQFGLGWKCLQDEAKYLQPPGLHLEGLHCAHLQTFHGGLPGLASAQYQT